MLQCSTLSELVVSCARLFCVVTVSNLSFLDNSGADVKEESRAAVRHVARAFAVVGAVFLEERGVTSAENPHHARPCSYRSFCASCIAH